MKDTTFSSKAYGTHEYKDLTIEGRVQFDVYMALQRDHKLSSYTLNAVSWSPGCSLCVCACLLASPYVQLHTQCYALPMLGQH